MRRKDRRQFIIGRVAFVAKGVEDADFAGYPSVTFNAVIADKKASAPPTNGVADLIHDVRVEIRDVSDHELRGVNSGDDGRDKRLTSNVIEDPWLIS